MIYLNVVFIDIFGNTARWIGKDFDIFQGVPKMEVLASSYLRKATRDRVVVDVEHFVVKGTPSIRPHRSKYLESIIHAAQFLPKGYDIELLNSMFQDKSIAPAKFDASKLVPRKLFTCQVARGNLAMSHEELCVQAIQFGGYLGLDHGERMLAEQDKIPSAFQKFSIPLPATTISLSFIGEIGVLQLNPKKVYVSPFLSYDYKEGRWDMGFNCIDDYCWDDTCCLAV